MRGNRINNVMFPIWLIWLMPPVIFFVLAGNFIIDSAVLLIAFYVFKVSLLTGKTVKELYFKTIFKVWIFGFVADIIGTAPLFLGVMTGIDLYLPRDTTTAIGMNPFADALAFLIVLACIMLAAIFIFILNYNITFKNTVTDRALKVKLALTLAVVTAPWTLFIPSEWFYI